jgi:peptidoglycan hydrolase-like protein with peptidoglycan-binding domain
MRIKEFITEKWTKKYKSSINCSHPKGFSQKAHCAGKKKHNEDMSMEMTCPDCGMCETHGNINEIKKGAKDSNGFTKCWPGKHAEGTKKGKNGGRVRNCVPNEGVTESSSESEATRRIQKMLNAKYGANLDIDGVLGPLTLQSINKYLPDAKKGLADDPSKTTAVQGKKDKDMSEDLVQEFDLIESIINQLAERNNVDAEIIWEDLESLTDDELYVFAVTQPVMEDWQKVNKRDKTDGMSKKAVNSYRREHPGSKLKTAVTTKPSKLKKGSKASKRRSSYCSRSRGQMKMHSISCAKTPDKAICKARRRWNC